MSTATADPPAQQDDRDVGLELEGSGQLTFHVGGREPTTSKLTVRGGAIEIDGSFDKGERVAILIEAEVREVAFRDQVDPKTGAVVGCTRKQIAHIVGVERAG
jgi:ribosomal protein L21E